LAPRQFVVLEFRFAQKPGAPETTGIAKGPGDKMNLLAFSPSEV
jgi:hypothetical protein